jgi:hypothetical protein
MIGDHHGWSDGQANLLVRAADAILGTYRQKVAGEWSRRAESGPQRGLDILAKSG